MQNKSLQLMVHGEGLGRKWASIDYPDVRLVSVTQVPNTNCLFVNLDVGVARFQEMLKGTASGVDFLSGQTVDLTRVLRLAPKSVLLIELPGA